MKKLMIYFLLIFSLPALCQPKAKPSAKSTKVSIPVLQKLLDAGKYNYEVVNDSLYQVEFTGDNVELFTLMISKISDLYVIAVDVTDAIKIELNPQKYKMLLKSNDAYDMIKIGISDYNDHLYVRCDTYGAITSAAVLKKLIGQVSAVTDIIAGELKK